MKKFDLTGAKLISLLVILPLFLWFTTLNRTVLQYKELHELKNEHGRTSQGEDEILITPKINLLTGSYLFNNYLGAATSEGCDIVSFTPCPTFQLNLGEGQRYKDIEDVVLRYIKTGVPVFSPSLHVSEERLKQNLE